MSAFFAASSLDLCAACSLTSALTLSALAFSSLATDSCRDRVGAGLGAGVYCCDIRSSLVLLLSLLSLPGPL